VIDLHSHILPGFDDGVRSLEEAREVARAALADGVTAMAATPHVRDDYPTRADRMEAAVAELRSDFAAQGIALDVLTGGEVALDRLPLLDPEELRRFALAGGCHVLLEFPYYGWPLGLEALLHRVTRARLTPVLGHPERNGEVEARPERLAPLVAGGALVQVTASSLTGRFGKRSRQAALKLVHDGLAHVVASDAHSPDLRAAGLSAAVAELRDGALARYLTEEAPGAIAAGEAVPPPPGRSRRRLRLRLRD
jgi:protein-tyrosine phosphatase